MGTQTLSGVSTLYKEKPERDRRQVTIPKRVLRWLQQYAEGIIAGAVLLIIVFSVTFAGQLSHHNPTAGMDLHNRFLPPVWEDGGSINYVLGTDNLGRDILTRILHGGQSSLFIAFTASTIATIFGIFYGVLSGYTGGMIERTMTRITDIWVSFPFLVLALSVIAVVGSSEWVLITLLSLAGWVYPARITHAQTLKVRNHDFVQASHALGASSWHIIWRHILPNVVSVNIVMWTFSVGSLILIEGSLSFLGLGVSPPTPSWGNMLSDGRVYLQDAWWLSVFPGLALMLTVLCVNSVGDTLQKLNNRQ